MIADVITAAVLVGAALVWILAVRTVLRERGGGHRADAGWVEDRRG